MDLKSELAMRRSYAPDAGWPRQRAECGDERHTLGTVKGASLAALGKGLVEQAGELAVADTVELVVGQYVFLECLTAGREC